MRRAPVVLGATAIGVAAVLSFRTHDLASTTGSTATRGGALSGATGSSGAATNSTGSNGAGTSGSSTNSSAGSSTSTATGSSTRVTTPTSATTSPSGTATGVAEETRYGVIQVRVTVSDGRITDVTTTELGATDPHSQQINAEAVPELRSEVLSAQSAQIDGVSGATFTSEGYEASLQSALDKIGYAK